ncbi:MAG: hypothetical protein LBI28_00195, partial [Treponema sp.]|nr:hypothetical protein [Treponema sp.]
MWRIETHPKDAMLSVLGRVTADKSPKEIFMIKKTIKWFGIIALAAIIGFGMAACDDNSDGGTDPFNGTWISADIKLVAANGSWKQYTIPENTEVIRGTYTYSGNTVTGKVV